MTPRNRRLSPGALRDPRVLEMYIRAQVLPRFMVRLREIEDQLAEHRLELERAYRELRQSCGDDPVLFERRWTAAARAWPFGELNELILQHNEYYPIERALPIDPRTGDYVTISGHPYERELVGPEWILERFPARVAVGEARSAGPAARP
jgi:hypothetical protein